MFRPRVPAAAGVAALTLTVGALTLPPAGAQASVTSAPGPVGAQRSSSATRVAAAVSANAATSTVVRDGVSLLRQRTSFDLVTDPTPGGSGRSDFDGDGRDDLAVTGYGFVREPDGSSSNSAGVVVTYSSAPYRDRITTDSEFGGGPAGEGVAAGDFDGDGFDDLAFSDSYEYDTKAKAGAGGVWIVPGGPSGLDIHLAQHVNQSTRGVPGASQDNDWFGSSLATGDVTGDGRDELLIGIPEKTVKGKTAAGAVVVLKGSASGVTTTDARWITQNTAGVPGAAEKNDRFGQAITVGPINKGRYRDVVIGAPGERSPDIGGGAIAQFWGSSAGVSLKNVTAVTGATIFDVAQTRKGYVGDVYVDEVGAQVAIADTNGDGTGEVVVGVPLGQDYNTIASGVVVTIPVRAAGLYAKGLIALGQQDKNIAGTAEYGDLFGQSIATGDVTGDGYEDVLVGAPGEKLGAKSSAGTVVLLRGSAKGLTGAKSRTITQSTAGVPGASEKGDWFGSAVAVLDLDGVGRLDAVITAPGELVGGDTEDQPSGTVTTLHNIAGSMTGGQVVSGRAVGLPGLEYGQAVAHP